jgi:preprotein translocase subunit SecE
LVASCGAAEQLNGERRRYRSQVLINRLARTKRVATRNNICSLPVADLPELSSTEMGRQVAVVLYVVAMAAVIVGVDFVFFRNRFWERLTANIGIVLVFAAFYSRFLRRP